MYVQGGFAIHMQGGGKDPIDYYELSWNHNYQLSSWVNVHVFVVAGWKWTPLLLIMQQFVDGDYVYNLTNLIVNALLDYGEFLKSNLGSKPMCFYHIWCHKFSKF
jgi:hypothetical protein